MSLTRYLHIAVSILLVLFIAGCDKDTTGPGDGDDGGDDEGGETESFTFPHPDGGDWIYYGDGHKNGSGEGNDVKFIFNGYSEHTYGGNVQNLEEWYYDSDLDEWVYSDTIYSRIFSGEIRYYFEEDDEDYEVWLKTSFEVGDSWVFNKRMDWEATVLAQEDITVPAGTFEDCYKIYYECQLPGGADLSFYIWYASGVGGKYGVKRVSELYENKELSEYTLPGK